MGAEREAQLRSAGRGTASGRPSVAGRGRRVALLSVGLFLVVLGTLTAVAIGPDNTVELGELTAPPPAAGLPVITHEELTGFQNLSLRMTASAPSGVFLAAGHRVDVQDLLSQRTRFELTRVSRTTLDGALREDGPAATFAQIRPDRIQGWHQIASPATAPDAPRGSATVVVPLGDSPVDLVAFPVAEDETLTVSLGVVSPTLHHGAWSVAGLGVGVLGLWCVATLRARRSLRSLLLPLARPVRWPVRGPVRGPVRRRVPRPGRHPGRRTARPALASSGAAPRPASRDAVVASTPDPPLSKLITVPILGAILLALVLQGCAMPRAVSTSDPALRPPLTLAEAATITPARPVTLHAPALDAYPLWALAELPGNSTAPEHRMQLLVRDRFSTPWRVADRTRIQTPGPRSRPHHGVAPDEVAAEVAAASAEVLRTVDTPAAARELLSAHVVVVDSGHLAFLQHRLWGEADTRVASVVLIPRDGAMSVLGSRVTEK